MYLVSLFLFVAIAMPCRSTAALPHTIESEHFSVSMEQQLASNSEILMRLERFVQESEESFEEVDSSYWQWYKKTFRSNRPKIRATLIATRPALRILLTLPNGVVLDFAEDQEVTGRTFSLEDFFRIILTYPYLLENKSIALSELRSFREQLYTRIGYGLVSQSVHNDVNVDYVTLKALPSYSRLWSWGNDPVSLTNAFLLAAIYTNSLGDIHHTERPLYTRFGIEDDHRGLEDITDHLVSRIPNGACQTLLRPAIKTGLKTLVNGSAIIRGYFGAGWGPIR